MINWRRYSTTLLVLGTILILAGCTFAPMSSGPSTLVGGLPDQPQQIIPASDADLAPFVAQQVIVRMDEGYSPEIAAERLDGHIVREIPASNAALIELPSDMQVVEAMRGLKRIEGVRYSDPNYTYATAAFGAPAFVDGRQWGPQKISAPVAWKRTTGSENVVIGVLDSGVDASHPELDGKVLLPGINTTSGRSDDTQDRFGHGTHVAAIAAAWGDRGDPIDGMLGIAWESHILPVKVLADNGTGSVASITEGIWAAVDWYEERRSSNPDLRMVINLSLGGRGYSMVMQEAIDKALELDIVVVAAMGNEGRGRLNFPAGYPGVIAVGATDPRDQRASFSTSGRHISVAAPGVDIHSAIPGGGYARWSGTSMATPHVAGAVALLLTDHPFLSVEEVKALLESTAERHDARRFDEHLGFGRIDVGRAIVGEAQHEYGTVRVDVVSGGQPVAYADLLLMDASGLPVATRRANEDGVALFFAVPEGAGYTVGTSHAPRDALSAPFPVVAGHMRRVTLQV